MPSDNIRSNSVRDKKTNWTERSPEAAAIKVTISVVDELIRNYKRDFFFVLAEAILTMLCRGKRCVFGVQCKNRKERERRKKKNR